MSRDEKERWIRIVNPSINPPSLKDNTADVDRLIKGLKRGLQTESVNISLSQIRRIPSFMKKHNYNVQVVLYSENNTWHMVDIFPPEKRAIYGVSVDLGTSTVVLRLVDLISGNSVEEVSFLNPQISIGPDILTRIHYACEPGRLEYLQKILLDKINNVIGEMVDNNQFDNMQVVGFTVAGNTTMTHLFLGLDPSGICREPYIPAVNSPGILRSSELGIDINPESPVFVLPSVGSYFGGDLIAGIIASGMTERAEVSMLVDVGTNAEVVVGNSEWLMACAGAAGPALEGGVAKMGMMAGPGAIDKVVIDTVTKEFQIQTIGDHLPEGICGSGMIDLAAQLFINGMIDMRGKFIPKNCGDRLMDIDGINHLRLVSGRDSASGKDLTLSQPDIDSLLRSKAAMYTILKTITHMVNLSMADIHEFYIAGTFGSYIDPRSAITLGMIPDLPLDTYRSLGNISLEGAGRVLLSSGVRDEVSRIRDSITYVELNVNQEFMNDFSAAKFIPHTDRDLFPSVSEYGAGIR